MTARVGRRSAPSASVAAALVIALSGCSVAGTPSHFARPTAAATTTAPQPSASCRATAVPTADPERLAHLGPSSGVWVGMNFDWAAETVADVTGRLGRPPATVVTFLPFPFTPGDAKNLDAAANQARQAGAVLIATLEPLGGLSTVTAGTAADLAARLARYGGQGVPSIIRFAHEMNGTWYPWGQDPTAYIAAFRRVADAVHAGAPTAAMLWAPNQGEGYPFSGGRYQPKPGAVALRTLDTNADGRLDSGDDPYAPYWPGAAWVDWVGMSLYHWGTAHPWGANVSPAAGKFGQMVSGTTPTSVVPIPDFYTDYAERYAKPMAIVETAAFYRPAGGGESESAIKTAWLGQVFSADTRSRFPLLRIVNWFEWRKFEPEVNAIVDWRISADPGLRASFLAAMTNGFALGPAVTKTAPNGGCASPGS